MAILVGALSAESSQASVRVGGRIGVAAPIQGDVQDDLNLDMGLGAGASIGFDLTELLAIDLRYDALLLYGDFSSSVDTSVMTHAISLGPEVVFRREPVEVYLGAHPGLYFTQLSIDGEIDPRPLFPRQNVNIDSDWSIDFGLNAELGVRWFLSEGFFLGAEATYNLVLLDDSHLGFDVEGTSFEGGDISDSMGTFSVGLTFGCRF